jgi:hypothetical protein
MKHRLQFFIYAGLLSFLVLMPSAFSLAVSSNDLPPKIPQIENPLGDRDDLGALLLYIVEQVTKIGFYVVVLFIIYSGFLFVKAAGNTKALDEAKQVFLYTVIGAAILLGAMVLARVIEGTVNQLEARIPVFETIIT